jgi:hypothetical protein
MNDESMRGDDQLSADLSLLTEMKMNQQPEKLSQLVHLLVAFLLNPSSHEDFQVVLGRFAEEQQLGYVPRVVHVDSFHSRRLCLCPCLLPCPFAYLSCQWQLIMAYIGVMIGEI